MITCLSAKYLLLCLQHYVAKTMENIAGQNGPWAAKIATLESTLSLYQV